MYIELIQDNILFLCTAELGRTVDLTMYYGARPRLREYARKMRKNPTKAENFLWQYLRDKKLDGRIFRRQHPIDIFIVDFYCHLLVIEADGGIHRETDIKRRAMDEQKRWNDLDLE